MGKYVYRKGGRRMTLANVIASLGGGALLVAAVKAIFASGKVVAGQERLEASFDDHRKESIAAAAEVRGQLQNHGERIAVLESWHPPRRGGV